MPGSDVERAVKLTTWRCLDGLATSASALAGSDVDGVCRTFARWREEGRRPWPWLPGLCFDALRPLDIDFPADDEDAVVLGRLLVAAETSPEVVRSSAGALARRASPERAAGVEPDGNLRSRLLLAAVERFWDELARVASELHELVVLGDRAEADRTVVETRRVLEDFAEEIERLAIVVAAAPSTPTPTPPPPPPPLEETGRLDPVDVPVPVPARPAAPGPASDPGGALRAERPLPPPRDVEYASVRDHRYAPVVFLLLMVAAAIAVLVNVAAT